MLKKMGPPFQDFYWDDSCTHCLANLRGIKEGTFAPKQKFILRPAINSSGIITHYHIGRPAKCEGID